MHTEGMSLRPGVRSLTGLSVGLLLVLATLIVRQYPSGAGTNDTDLGPEDLGRLGISVEAIDDSDGLLSADDVLAIARDIYDPPGSSADVDAFLYAVTDASTARSDRPLRGDAVWIVRYSGLSVQSPSGVELHFAYYYFDATSGEFLLGHWYP